MNRFAVPLFAAAVLLSGAARAQDSSPHTLPGAPDGDYVVIQYATVFANKARAVETVVPMRTPDGSWKVSGYYIR